MSEKQILNNSKIGYIFHQPTQSTSPGAEWLEVFLRDQPIGCSFDAQKMHLRVVSSDGSPSALHVHHPWDHKTVYQVIPGVIEIIDHLGDKVEAFNFGGKLTIASQDELTTTSLSSPVPIFEINTDYGVQQQFVEEVEILMAELRATLLANLSAFEVRLSEVDPTTFYQASINALMRKYDTSRLKYGFQTTRLCKFLHAEQDRLEKNRQWAYPPPEFKALLQPGVV